MHDCAPDLAEAPDDASMSSTSAGRSGTVVRSSAALKENAVDGQEVTQQWEFEDAERPRSAVSSVSPPSFVCSSFVARAGWLVRCVSPESGIKSDVAIQ